LAEAILRAEVAARGLDALAGAGGGWEVASAGTSSEHEGDGADERSVAVGRRLGKLDLTRHRAQQLTADHWRQYDFILAMDSSNMRNANRVKPKDGQSHGEAGEMAARLQSTCHPVISRIGSEFTVLLLLFFFISVVQPKLSC
jgi:protein-tyrosine-phosphatase